MEFTPKFEGIQGLHSKTIAILQKTLPSTPQQNVYRTFSNTGLKSCLNSILKDIGSLINGEDFGEASKHNLLREGGSKFSSKFKQLIK